MRIDSDLILIIGLIVAGMSVPAIISAFSASRPPRAAAISAVIGGALIIAALSLHPGGYRMQDLPDIATVHARTPHERPLLQAGVPCVPGGQDRGTVARSTVRARETSS